MGAPFGQCAHSATIWVPGHTRNPYFAIIGASLLFDNRFLMFLLHWGYGIFGFSPTFTHPPTAPPPLFSHFLLISLHVLLSRLISDREEIAHGPWPILGPRQGWVAISDFVPRIERWGPREGKGYVAVAHFWGPGREGVK